MRRSFRRMDENIFRQRFLNAPYFSQSEIKHERVTDQLVDDLVTALDELAPYMKSTRRCVNHRADSALRPSNRGVPVAGSNATTARRKVIPTRLHNDRLVV